MVGECLEVLVRPARSAMQEEKLDARVTSNASCPHAKIAFRCVDRDQLHTIVEHVAPPFECATNLWRADGLSQIGQPRYAASIAAMSIFVIWSIASNARLAAAVSESVIALVRITGVICQDNPHLSLHQPHALSSPPLATIAFQ